MTDSLGYRMKFGVVAPSTNTSVQPEFDDMRPVGVTNHFSRIIIPNDPVATDDDFNTLVMRIRAATMDAIDAAQARLTGDQARYQATSPGAAWPIGTTVLYSAVAFLIFLLLYLF